LHFGQTVQTLFLFQSLFCWKTLANRKYPIRPTRLYHKFQSLFCWKTLANNLFFRRTVRPGTWVSILVLLEDPRQQDILDICNHDGDMFQSLFCWKTLANFFMGKKRRGALRFNPCFAGRPSPTHLALADHPSGICFNPCFAGRPSPTSLPRSASFAPASFNPCFAGRPSPTNPGPCPLNQNPGVSILVLLEDPRQLLFLFFFVAQKRVSILVLLEDPRQLVESDAGVSRFTAFQSLFCWKTLANSRVLARTGKILLFQSLFCWKTLANVLANYGGLLCRLVVSILVLLEDPRQQFGGNLRREFKMSVSILVLLEDPRQPETPGPPASAPAGFNPCFAGRPSPT